MNNRIFSIFSGHDLVVRKTREVIPEDEPVFILRARDYNALSTVRVYQSLFAPMSEHWKTIQMVIDDFTKFREESLEKMGKPEEVY